MVYTLQLADERVKAHQVTSMHLISAFAFLVTGAIVYVYIYTMSMPGLALLLLGLLLLGITIFKNRWLLKHANNLIIRIVELVIAVIVLFIALQHHLRFPVVIFGMVCFGLLVALYIERTGNRIQSLQIDDTGIRLPMPTRKRFIAWHDAEHVILKNNVLSINCVDNTFYQWNIRKTDINEKQFTTWCNGQIEVNIEKRVKNNW